MRPRIRQLKPELFLDEDFWELQQQNPGLPLLQGFQGLWCFADREGRFEWRPRMLKNLILPYWEGDFATVLDALLSARLVVRYEVAGRAYGAVRTFSKHQMPNNRENKSVLPQPDADALPEPDQGGFVYVASLSDGSSFKVGFSRRDPELRVNDLSNGSPEPLHLVEYIEGDYALETEIHRALKPYNRHREWFASSDECISVLSRWFTRDPRVRVSSATRPSPRRPLPPLPTPNTQPQHPTHSSAPESPPPEVPGLVVVYPGPLQPSKRDQARNADPTAGQQPPGLRYRFRPDWAPSVEHGRRAQELGLTREEVFERAEDCLHKPIKHGFHDEDAHFFRELTWLKTDKEKRVFKSAKERDAFENPGRERRPA